MRISMVIIFPVLLQETNEMTCVTKRLAKIYNKTIHRFSFSPISRLFVLVTQALRNSVKSSTAG